MDVNLALLRDHILGDDVEVRKRLVHEGGDVVCSLQNLGIDVAVDEVEQLVEHLFDVVDLVQVRHDQRLLRHELLLLLLEPLVELVLYFLLFVLQFLLQVKEPLVDVLHLLELQPLQLLLNLLQQLAVLVIEPLCI